MEVLADTCNERSHLREQGIFKTARGDRESLDALNTRTIS
jgi:hypothetical protein